MYTEYVSTSKRDASAVVADRKCQATVSATMVVDDHRKTILHEEVSPASAETVTSGHVGLRWVHAMSFQLRVMVVLLAAWLFGALVALLKGRGSFLRYVLGNTSAAMAHGRVPGRRQRSYFGFHGSAGRWGGPRDDRLRRARKSAIGARDPHLRRGAQASPRRLRHCAHYLAVGMHLRQPCVFTETRSL